MEQYQAKKGIKLAKKCPPTWAGAAATAAKAKAKSGSKLKPGNVGGVTSLSVQGTFLNIEDLLRDLKGRGLEVGTRVVAKKDTEVEYLVQEIKLDGIHMRRAKDEKSAKTTAEVQNFFEKYEVQKVKEQDRCLFSSRALDVIAHFQIFLCVSCVPHIKMHVQS